MNKSEYYKKVVNFSRHWSKLDNKVYTTIRHRLVLRVKHIYPVILRNEGKIQDIIVEKREREYLTEIEPNIIIQDTDSRNLKEAFGKLNFIKRKGCEKWNKAYKPINFKTEKYNIYTLKVVKRYYKKRLTDFIKVDKAKEMKVKKTFKRYLSYTHKTLDELMNGYRKSENKDDYF